MRNEFLKELCTSVEILSPSSDVDTIRNVAMMLLAKYEVNQCCTNADGNYSNDFLLESYLLHMKDSGFAESTIKYRKISLNRYLLDINKPLSDITYEDSIKYSREMKTMASSKSTTIANLRSFHKWAYQNGYTRHNVWDRHPKIKTPNRLSKSMNIIDLEKIRNNISNKRDRAIFETIYSTGCRLSEIINAKTSDLNTTDMTLTVIGKGDKQRNTFISKKCMYYLKDYLDERRFKGDECEYLFSTNRKPYRKMSSRTVQTMFDKISDGVCLSRKLTPHVLRHTFATLSHESGMEISDVQKILGHSSMDTTLMYAYRSDSKAKNAHQRYHIT